MKRETVVLSFTVVASFTACAPEYILGEGGETGGSANGASGAFESGGLAGNEFSHAGSSVIANHSAGGAAGSSSGNAAAGGRVGTGGTSGAMTIGSAAGNAEAGAPSPPLSVVCDSGIHAGGYVNRCALGLGEAGAGGAPGSLNPIACQAYDLVGAYWDGDTTHASCSWKVDDISPSAGTGIERGALASLNGLLDNDFIETIDGLHAVAIGSDIPNRSQLFTLELATGITTTTPLPDTTNPTLAGELSPGRYVVVGWDAPSTSEIAYIFDVRTGVWSIGGYFKSLMYWTSQVVINRATACLYALGTPATSSPTLLYTVCLSDDPQGNGSTVDYRPFAWNGAFGGITDDGQIVAANNDGSVWYVATIDPTTLSVTRKGTFSDLSGMSRLVYDTTAGVAYAVGQDNSGTTAPFLYGVNLASGSSTKVSVSHEYMLARQ